MPLEETKVPRPTSSPKAESLTLSHNLCRWGLAGKDTHLNLLVLWVEILGTLLRLQL